MDLNSSSADFRPTPFMPRSVAVERRQSGELIVTCERRLDPGAPHIPALLAQVAASCPDRIWLAQRPAPGSDWRRVTYAEGKRLVDHLTQGLLGLDLAKPVLAILSGNSIEHALISIAAMQAGIAVAPISQAYSAAGNNFSKLLNMIGVIEPGAVFVQNTDEYRDAITSIKSPGLKVIHAGRTAEPKLADEISFDSLAATSPGPEVMRSVNALQPDAIAKFLFTSGSTGTPKAVIHTHRVLAANVVMQQQVQPRDPVTQPPVVALDWLPWSHVMGGNAVFNGIIASAGTLFIDDGRPIPALFDRTIHNLKEVSPTRFSNVPAGFAMLADALENDDLLSRRFFKNLETLGYAGARLPDALYTRIQALAVKYAGHKIPFISGYGATEMGPSATTVYWSVDRVGLIGLPHPGVQMKLIPLPDDDRFEIRLRSEGMTPGYYRNAEQTASAMDEDGYFRTGDAARFVNPDDPREGFEFAGRISEEFKLLTGTFVRVGELRLSILEACPGLADLVVTAPDRPYVGILAWPRPGCSENQIAEHLRRYNAHNESSSRFVGRMILLREPPSLAAGEITDKGYVNQKAVLTRRSQLVDGLYADPPMETVVDLGT